MKHTFVHYLIIVDVLPIPVSTVDSEFAFHMDEECVVESYISLLFPIIVEALICTHDWILTGRKHIYEEEEESEIS
ncbi:putative HAT dimerization domain-containing protein [Helianthus debilis subsp. tardiflorus]